MKKKKIKNHFLFAAILFDINTTNPPTPGAEIVNGDFFIERTDMIQYEIRVIFMAIQANELIEFTFCDNLSFLAYNQC